MSDSPTQAPDDDHPGASDGDSSNELTAQVYQQLRRIAASRLAEQAPGHTLQATALVHEAFLKLQSHPSIFGAERGKFFHAAAAAMRQVLIDHARTKGRQKRGNGARRAIADVAQLAAEQDPEEIVALDEAIHRLEGTDPRAAEIVKLRFFAGLSMEETSEATGLSIRTVNREWIFARAWLFRALE